MDDFKIRLIDIAEDIKLAENFNIIVSNEGAPVVPGQKGDEGGMYYYQIQCWRRDVVTGAWGFGYGGKAYVNEHSTDSELIQTIFGLYKGYWEHEARETFEWRGRRVFGPHMDIRAVWDVANVTDASLPVTK